MLEKILGLNAGKVCKRMADCYAIIGIIASIIMAYVSGNSLTGYYYSRYERNWGLTFVILLIGIGSTLFVSFILYTLGDIHEELINFKYQYNTDNIKSPSIASEEEEISIKNGG